MEFSVQALQERFVEALTAWGPSVVAALAILVIGRIVAGIIRAFMRRLFERTLDPIVARFLSSIAYILLMALIVIAALGRLGVNTTSFAAVIAAAGLAIGLALQGSLGNFAAGVMIVFFRPFKVGDFVEVAGTSGKVDEVNVFHTKLKTTDNKVVIIGNGDVTSNNIVNYSAEATRRVDLVFGIGYDDDIDKARSLIQSVMDADERILAEPAPVIMMLELADSSVNFAVRPWVESADYWDVRGDLLENVKKTFDREGVSIPFPQRDVHLHQVAS